MTIPIVEFAESGNLEKVIELIDGEDIHSELDENMLESSSIYNYSNPKQWWIDYALRMASWKGHLPVVQYLVDNGADIHNLSDWSIRYASWCCRLDVVEYLIRNSTILTANIMQGVIRMDCFGNQLELLQHFDKRGIRMREGRPRIPTWTLAYADPIEYVNKYFQLEQLEIVEFLLRQDLLTFSKSDKLSDGVRTILDKIIADQQ